VFYVSKYKTHKLEVHLSLYHSLGYKLVRNDTGVDRQGRLSDT
jgi:hypothetical protein